MNTSDPIRLFIGSSSNGEDVPIEAIYEHTLRENTERELEIVWMRQTRDMENFWGIEKDATQRWPTPFSGYRWMIPEYCEFKGRAIYTDCDMINFRDIGDLWDTDLKGKPVAARKGYRFGGHEFCVMVIDCEKMGDLVSVPARRQKSNPEFHVRMIGKFSGNDNFVEELDPRWNCLDGEDREVDDMYQLHWTNMATQPWEPWWFTGTAEEHPRKDLVELFEQKLIEANDAGFYGQAGAYPPLEYNIIGK